jgi:hypothetical protein
VETLSRFWSEAGLRRNCGEVAIVSGTPAVDFSAAQPWEYSPGNRRWQEWSQATATAPQTKSQQWSSRLTIGPGHEGLKIIGTNVLLTHLSTPLYRIELLSESEIVLVARETIQLGRILPNERIRHIMENIIWEKISLSGETDTSIASTLASISAYFRLQTDQ